MTPKPRPLKRLIQKLTDARDRHRERHRPTGFGFLIADRISYLDDRQWDQLTAPASVFLQRPYLQVLERFAPDNLTPRYAMVYRGEQPVAAVVAQLVGIAGPRISGKKSMRGLKEQCLVCGNLLSWGPHGVAFAPGEDPHVLWPGVAEALYRIRRAEKLSGEADFVMVKDLPPAESPAALERFSYRPLETEPNMVLEFLPEWRRYEDYTGSLGGKYKKSARQMHEAFAGAGCTVERLTDLHPHTDKLHALYLQTHEQAKVRPVTLLPGFIPSLAQAMGDHFRCTVIRQAG
jgi:hypothetical protein